MLITGRGQLPGGGAGAPARADPDIEYVAGLDERPPRARLERTELIEADIRNPLIAKLLPRAGGHRGPQPDHPAARDRACPPLAHDMNVIGSLQLLAACEKAETLRTIVVRGSAGIYGARARTRRSSSPRR